MQLKKIISPLHLWQKCPQRFFFSFFFSFLPQLQKRGLGAGAGVLVIKLQEEGGDREVMLK